MCSIYYKFRIFAIVIVEESWCASHNEIPGFALGYKESQYVLNNALNEVWIDTFLTYCRHKVLTVVKFVTNILLVDNCFRFFWYIIYIYRYIPVS